MQLKFVRGQESYKANNLKEKGRFRKMSKMISWVLVQYFWFSKRIASFYFSTMCFLIFGGEVCLQFDLLNVFYLFCACFLEPVLMVWFWCFFSWCLFAVYKHRLNVLMFYMRQIVGNALQKEKGSIFSPLPSFPFTLSKGDKFYTTEAVVSKLCTVFLL